MRILHNYSGMSRRNLQNYSTNFDDHYIAVSHTCCTFSVHWCNISMSFTWHIYTLEYLFLKYPNVSIPSMNWRSAAVAGRRLYPKMSLIQREFINVLDSARICNNLQQYMPGFRGYFLSFLLCCSTRSSYTKVSLPHL